VKLTLNGLNQVVLTLAKHGAQLQMHPPYSTPTLSPREVSLHIPARELSEERPEIRGKFLYLGDRKLWIKGVTYGTFRPNSQGDEYPERSIVDRDFALMAENGLNAIRTYTVPPAWMLDLAALHGLFVMVGTPWEQHIAFMDDRRRQRSIEERVRAGVRFCMGHPAVLCHAIGNEIPASIVRWHGRRRVERFLERLYLAAKAENPEGLFTYVNFPSTEYLELPFLDLVCFNVYLETQEAQEAYLGRLHNIAGDRPLVMAELGLDSLRHGDLNQAMVLSWQLRTVFENGCAGTFVFSWTDEWHRGGMDIEDWRFGITDRDRNPKPALLAVQDTFTGVPFASSLRWPRISVVVCAYNESATIRECLEALAKVEYPDFEVIVVDDGSEDGTAQIAGEYDVRVISISNHGLSHARNLGLREATGAIIAYLDADAYPDPHWLSYLASTFVRNGYAAVGGPNLPPPDDGPVSQCVASSPGGPIHVLLSDTEAEHIPGCNMAFRRDMLEAIGGFDTQFRIAGDDVDVCWRLQERGCSIGFNPAAVVWHHRRNSVRAYWRQQLNYGRAEAMLEKKWPEKYNELGHLTWAGRVYGNGHLGVLGRRGRIYHGTWNSALFQSLYRREPGFLQTLTMMPEWYLIIITLLGLSALGSGWKPLLFTLPLLVLSLGILLLRAWMQAGKPMLQRCRRPTICFRLRMLTVLLHLLQPIARLYGRLSHGLHPWRWPSNGFSFPIPRNVRVWSEQWRGTHEWLQGIEDSLRRHRRVVIRGGDYDRWDLEARSGTMGGARLRMALEEHGQGKQLLRFRIWPRCPLVMPALILLFALLAIRAAFESHMLVAIILSVPAILLSYRAFGECASSMGAMISAARELDRGKP
jgi:GT2 family glycosyltransferase